MLFERLFIHVAYVLLRFERYRFARNHKKRKPVEAPPLLPNIPRPAYTA